MAPMEKVIELAQAYKEQPRSAGGMALLHLCNYVEEMLMLAVEQHRVPTEDDVSALSSRAAARTPPSR